MRQFRLLQLTLLLVFVVHAGNMFACAFHSFPPFAADWYHPTFYQLLYNRKQSFTIGYAQSGQVYSRSFHYIPELPSESEYDQLLAERILHKSFYLQFKLLDNLLVYAAVSETQLDADAAADDGMLTISSNASNQLQVQLAQDIRLVNREHLSFVLQPTAGLATNLWAKHAFYSKIAWLKYQWDKFSPRLQAGNFTNSFQAGLNTDLQVNDLRVMAGVNARYFSPTSERYHYGDEVNCFAQCTYTFAFTKKKLMLEPQAGILFEQASLDSQEEPLEKDEDVYAGGQSLLASFGLVGGIEKGKVGVTYFLPLRDRGFTEFQLYNRSRLQLFFQYSF